MSKNRYVLNVVQPYDIEPVAVHVSEEDFCRVIEKISEDFPILREEEMLCRDFLFLRSYYYIDNYGHRWLIGCVFSDNALTFTYIY